MTKNVKKEYCIVNAVSGEVEDVLPTRQDARDVKNWFAAAGEKVKIIQRVYELTSERKVR